MQFSKINKSSNSVASSAFILATSLLASRILGLVRDRIFASRFGAGIELDVYFAGFRIPDLVYSVIIGGAVSSAFIPVFISHFTRNKKEAWDLARAFLYVVSVGIILVCGVMYFFMPSIMNLVVPGFSPEYKVLAVAMSRIMLLSPLFLSISAVFSGVLHSFRKFFVYSLAPIFYNIGIIVGALFFTPRMGIFGLAWGVALGAFLHLLVQVPASMGAGFSLGWPRKIFSKGFRRIMSLMLPRAFGLGANQVNLWVITAIASTLSVGSLTIFNLANHLQYLPIGIIGISFATAVFPSLSQALSDKKYKEYLRELSRTLRTVFYLVVPLSVLLFILRAQIVRIVLGTGQFGWEATQLTAASLGAFTLGIVSYALMPVLARAFYAQENTKTPVIANMIGIAVNIFLSFLLIYVIFPRDGILKLVGGVLKINNLPSISIIGLPIAFSLSGIVAFALLIGLFLREERNRIISKELHHAFWRILLVSVASGFVAWFMLQIFVLFSSTNTFIAIFLQALFAGGVALAVYFILSYLFKFEEFFILHSFVRRVFPLREAPIVTPDDTSGEI